MGFFRTNHSNYKGFTWPASQERACLSSPDLVYKQWTVVSGGSYSQRQRLSWLSRPICKSAFPAQAPLFKVQFFLGTPQRPSSGTSSEASLLGEGVEGKLKNTSLLWVSTQHLFIPVLPPHPSFCPLGPDICRDLLFTGLPTVRYPPCLYWSYFHWPVCHFVKENGRTRWGNTSTPGSSALWSSAELLAFRTQVHH